MQEKGIDLFEAQKVCEERKNFRRYFKDLDSEVNYIRNFDFYHGYLIACFMADIIESGEEYKKLIDWIKTLDINGGKENGK
jgi:hypothetical protein